MTTRRGEVFHVAHDSLAVDTPTERTEKRAALELSWAAFSRAAWAYFWHRRNDTLYSFRLFGLRVYTLTWRRVLKPAWGRAFGTCPFSWKAGPDV